MLAIELAGIHIGKWAVITQRNPIKRSTRRYVRNWGQIQEIHHYGKGDVKIDWSSSRFPADAIVELYDTQKEAAERYLSIKKSDDMLR